MLHYKNNASHHEDAIKYIIICFKLKLCVWIHTLVLCKTCVAAWVPSILKHAWRCAIVVIEKSLKCRRVEVWSTPHQCVHSWKQNKKCKKNKTKKKNKKKSFRYKMWIHSNSKAKTFSATKKRIRVVKCNIERKLWHMLNSNTSNSLISRNHHFHIWECFARLKHHNCIKHRMLAFKTS